MGISEPDIPHLFQQFSQLDSSVSRRFGGTGLGLAISQRLVARMGGVIGVRSAVGKGSDFHFSITLPLGAPLAGQPPRVRARLAGQRVLIMHEDQTGARLLARQIESRGGHVVCCATPAEAMGMLLRETAMGHAFHACIIDHGLHAGGAEAVARQVRADARLAAVRLILVSASDFGPAADGEAARLFDARLLKPVPVDTLIFRLMGSSGEPGPPQATGAALGPTATSSGLMRILVAEDNQTNQAVIRAMLAKLGHRADIVANGLEAVDAMRERPYDLVFMDVMMPEMDGIAATHAIRKLHGAAGDVRIVALTADASAEHHAAYRECGMQAVLVKPVTLRALETAIAAG